MKYLLLVITLFLFSCRSTTNQQKSSDLTVLKGSEITSFATIKDSITRTILQRLQTELKEKIYIKEYYPPLPGDTIQYVKSETTIERGKNEVFETKTLETGTSEEKNVQKAIDSTYLATNTKEHTEKLMDSRPVQGKDWLWLSLGAGIVVIVFIIILVWYLKRKVPP